MDAKEAGATPCLVAELPRGPRCKAARRDFIAANREEILDELLDTADPDVPPTDEAILGLILANVGLRARNGRGQTHEY